MTPDKIHTNVVPRLQAILWTAALFVGTVCFQNIESAVLKNLVAIFIIFLVFMWESAIMFLDVKSANPDKNFDGEVLGINAKLFFIIPLPFIIGAMYYAFPQWKILFYLLMPIMGWIKYECSAFANNIQSHFVSLTRPTFTQNKINT
ncbi:MAG: hypothetical protein K2M97_05995 [Muribaculaceae bacterium]|nr:hypothetical protein [Muribaculaceae bacterium]